MHGTTRGLRSDFSSRLAELERRQPEWRAWLRLLAEVGDALEEDGAPTPFAAVELGPSADAPAGVAPLLHGRMLMVDGARLQRLVHRLASIASARESGDLPSAASLRDYRPSRAEAVTLLEAAVQQDRAAIDALAVAAGVDPAALGSLGELAALPSLHACRRVLEASVPRHWPHGYCPICAGGPLLVEHRGLDRSRWARCGRCGAAWAAEWLRCLYCGEREHARLGSLVPEAGGDVLKVETCASCRGYLKSVATLVPVPPLELLLRDLETVELDLVALDRGYRRPGESGFPLRLRVVARASRRMPARPAGD
jgi:FdhE protein